MGSIYFFVTSQIATFRTIETVHVSPRNAHDGSSTSKWRPTKQKSYAIHGAFMEELKEDQNWWAQIGPLCTHFILLKTKNDDRLQKWLLWAQTCFGLPLW